MALIVYTLGGAAVRALFGIYCAWKNQGWIRIDYRRLAIEFVAAAFFGYISSWLLSGFFKGFGVTAWAFVGGLGGADLLNILAKHIGITKGFQIAVEKVPAYDGLNFRQQKALQYAMGNGIANSQYREMNKVSDPTAQRELSALVRKGFLKQTGKGKGTRYVF